MKTAKHSSLSPSSSNLPVAPGAEAQSPTKELASAPAVVASVFSKLNLERRARLLGRLLGSVGPLALVVVGGGVFAKYLRNARWSEVPVSLEDAARATWSQVHDLARYAEQSNPHLVDGLLSMLLKDGVTMTALGASVAALTVKHLTGRRGWKPHPRIKA
jgi:hypothetical protein